ncbi:membrane protein [Ureibacillus massiliensis 4400831 = CIP 108448 = CCUG 49529]|uniref:Membrane protein n=1 Tax=Ureibacillus massiliensis 4400831 = CIP 108448 = CCUG 49529 TaxID=1211035 RepID=A0A0A3J412_9BACL|nr:hypothetical protein [Ureibacillus massiliensis]KGR90440.1 membrane protein [Ureibacillus massiliensis 4400831 = CIP 108448 = CCUG 49529]RKJ31326.1 hypothetical protein D7X33_40525 [Butyricicoccus sp. 1XD8-22]
MKRKRRKSYNPYLLPPWLRKVRFYCKQMIIPIAVFQGLRTLFLPTTGDFLLLILLIFIAWLLWIDFI